MTSSTVFFFNDTATTEIYPLSLHDALPIWLQNSRYRGETGDAARRRPCCARLPSSPTARHCGYVLVSHAGGAAVGDRKSTRLNSSHANISYAVFCLKKNTTPLTRLPSSLSH